MRPNTSTQRWFAAAVCVLATASFAAAEEGVVRISDASKRPGVVRMNTPQRSVIQQTAYGTAGYSGARFSSARPVMAQRYQAAMTQQAYRQQSVGQTPPAYQPISFSSGHSGCGTEGCNASGGCNTGCNTGCNSGCQSGQCDYSPSGREARKMRKQAGECDVCLADDYDDRMCRLFARACPDDGCTRWPTRWWRGQQMNYLSRNQRLSNTLFGWMVPSGLPPVGCYNVTYANDPGYSDSRDGGSAYGAQGPGAQGYGAQGYGVPVNVPVAPNVRQSYNYSWGTPSSRITPMGQYSAAGSAQQSPYQSW